MKLTLIRPVIFEAFDDDKFGNGVPTDPEALVAALKRREKAIKHEYLRVHRENTDIATTIPKYIMIDAFPGGDVKANNALRDGSWIRVSSEVMVPNIPENRPLIDKATALYNRFLQLFQAKITIHNKILVAQNSASEYIAKSIDKSKTEQIPESQVPLQISSGAKGKFQNPYFLSDVGRYAGDPENFPWTPHMHKMYTALKDILDKNGIPGFTVAYGSTIVDSVRQGASLINYSNFAVIGANGKLIWRKYDKGGGSGQNWLYINGNKTNTSRFIFGTTTKHAGIKAEFDKRIAALKRHETNLL